MEPIRVLQVFTIMNRGGAESMIMNYYRKMDKNKVQFDFLVHRKEKAAFDDEIISLGGKIFKMPPINPLNPKKYFDTLRVFFEENNRYSIIHSHLNTFSNFPLKIAKEFNIPTRIAHAHIAIDKVSFSTLFFGKENFQEGLKKLIKYQLRKRVKKNATHLFSCGKKAGEWLFGVKSEFILMNNAIDTDKFAFSLDKKNKIIRELGLENKFVIGHVGRFNYQKNHNYLIDIFENIKKLNPNALLLLIGEGGLKKTIKEKVAQLNLLESVKFLGLRSDVSELMSSFDAFVFPSFYEGLPVTLIEAQAGGVNVFASNTITNEVALTSKIQFLNIKATPKEWAKIILATQTELSNATEKVKLAGYDIVENSKRLETFYLSQYR